MNADRKLISQPSVDSENNERVSTDRVGSFPFHAYNQYPTIYVCTHTTDLHCTRIVWPSCSLPSSTSISFFPLLFIYFIFHIDHFSFISLFVYLFFFNFWYRLFQTNVELCRFPVCVLYSFYRLFLERCEHRENGTEFFLILFFPMKNKKCSFGKIDF